MLADDLSVTNLIHSDFAILNRRLAEHYGIEGVQGEQFRRVTLSANSHRGGLLTQASVLKVTANGTVTSPVLRGAWVMKHLLGQPPLPPPADVGSIEPDTRGATTIREQLAAHRNSATCAACHRTIDPPGFALESFDVIGGWRERYRSQDRGDRPQYKLRGRSIHEYKLGPTVDASGELAGGQTFENIDDFKQLLLAQKDQVARALVRNLLVYGTGAGIQFADRDEVEAILARAEHAITVCAACFMRLSSRPRFKPSDPSPTRCRTQPHRSRTIAMPNPMLRRTFLRASGVALALPALDAMLPRSAWGAAAEAAVPRRSVFICTSLGLHGPHLFPQQMGRDYELTPYLDLLQEHRADFTVFSGLSHPDQAGANGHSSEMTWLTSSRNPGLGGFRNSLSVDQLIAEKIGFETRYPSLILSTSGQTSQSYTRSGVMIPADTQPSRVFAKLFLDGTPSEIKSQTEKLRQGRSILDAVNEEARRFERRVGAADRQKLAEYFSSVREMEQRLAKAEEWAQRPKPKVEAAPPQDINNASDLIGRMQLLLDLIPLTLQTDSTRSVAVLVQGRNDLVPVPGVTIDHHNLSHHGQDPEKIAQLKLIESELFKSFGRLLGAMAAQREAGARLLDNTVILFGSNLGNANSHDWHNLPVILAGGGFKHGQHVAYDAKHNTPLSNLFVTMLQRMGLEIDRFGSSTSTLTEIV